MRDSDEGWISKTRRSSQMDDRPSSGAAVAGRKELRERVLRAIYDKRNGEPGPVNVRELEVELQLDREHLGGVTVWLADQGFTRSTTGEFVHLTRDGCSEVESSVHRIVVDSMDTLEAPEAGSRDPRKVFVIYGRDEQARASLFALLRAFHLLPMEWTELLQLTEKGSPYVGEVLDKGFSEAAAVVALLTPDDVAYLRKSLHGPDEDEDECKPTGQARPNVLFELGMAFGRHPERTVIVELGRLRQVSDIGGRHTVRLDNSSRKRQELGQKLKSCGCAVNMNGTDWHTAGSFEPRRVTAPDLIITEATSGATDAQLRTAGGRVRELRGRDKIQVDFTAIRQDEEDYVIPGYGIISLDEESIAEAKRRGGKLAFICQEISAAGDTVPGYYVLQTIPL